MRERRARPQTRGELARDRALDAISHMRSRGLTLTQASKIAGTSPATVKKYAARALTRVESGGYTATRSDRYARTLYFLTERGKIALTVPDSRTASQIAKYWDAVDHYLKTGRSDRLQPFRGVVLRGRKEQYPFITDLRTLKRLGHAGEVSFEDLYAVRG